MDFINSFGLPKDAAIIDIGGGDSNLVDSLIEQGYTNITVLDISGKALERAKDRLGEKAAHVKWIESDIRDFVPMATYAVWHDRAALHFLTDEDDIARYAVTVANVVTGYMVIGAFSEDGPKKCSGLEIKQYSEAEMERQFAPHFEKITCMAEAHTTPFDTVQHFIFCSFKKS